MVLTEPQLFDLLRIWQRDNDVISYGKVLRILGKEYSPSNSERIVRKAINCGILYIEQKPPHRVALSEIGKKRWRKKF